MPGRVCTCIYEFLRVRERICVSLERERGWEREWESERRDGGRRNCESRLILPVTCSHSNRIVASHSLLCWSPAIVHNWITLTLNFVKYFHLFYNFYIRCFIYQFLFEIMIFFIWKFLFSFYFHISKVWIFFFIF